MYANANERHIFLSSELPPIVAYKKLERYRGIACVWMSCQPREASSGFVLAFAARSEILVPQMACVTTADRPEPEKAPLSGN